MSDMNQFASNCFFILFMVMSKSSLSRAQTFQNPSLSTPTRMVEGNQYNIHCTCVATGLNVSLTWARTEPSKNLPGHETCTPNTDVLYTYTCSSTYTFTARRHDTGASLRCEATQAGNSETKSKTVLLKITALANNDTTQPDTILDSTSPKTIGTSENNSSSPKHNGTKGDNPTTASKILILLWLVVSAVFSFY